jgi:hypothetical protein
MNLSVEEQSNIKPKGTLSGSVREQQWQILNWHEKRLKQLTGILIKYEENLKTMATEIVQLKTEIETLKN